MRIAEMYYIKMSDVHENKVLTKQALISLVDKSFTCFPLLYLQVSDVRPGTTSILQEACGVGHIPTICTILDTALYTPPQVDIFLCRNREEKAVRKRRWLLTPLAPHTSFPVLPWKKAIYCSFQFFVTNDDTLAVKPIVPLVFAEYSSCKSAVLLSTFLPFMVFRTYTCSDSPSYLSFRYTDVQMYFPPVVVQKSNDNRRSVSHTIVLEMQDESIVEEDQKKKGNQPEPGKPEPGKPEPEKTKPRREGDKGSKEGKEPNTDGLVPATLQKKKASLI